MIQVFNSLNIILVRGQHRTDSACGPWCAAPGLGVTRFCVAGPAWVSRILCAARPVAFPPGRPESQGPLSAGGPGFWTPPPHLAGPQPGSSLWVGGLSCPRAPSGCAVGSPSPRRCPGGHPGLHLCGLLPTTEPGCLVLGLGPGELLSGPLGTQLHLVGPWGWSHV